MSPTRTEQLSAAVVAQGHVGRGDVGQPVHVQLSQHVPSIWINLDELCVNLRALWDIFHAALTLFFLQLQRDASHWPTLDAFHQVSCESSNLVPQTLGWNGGNLLCNLLVDLEIKGQLRVVLLDNHPSGLLHSLCSNTTHSLEWEREGAKDTDSLDG